MLRSSRCALTNKSNEALAKMGECPHDTGGYFIVKGQEKVIMIQEQMTKNRVLVYEDANKGVYCSVASFTDERKSTTTVIRKNDNLVVTMNVCSEVI